MMRKPPHPGEIIAEDVLGELELTVAEAAKRLGVSRFTLSRVIQGNSGISPNLAIRLERAGVGTALAWMTMQTNYDLARELDGKTHDVQPLVVT